MAEGTPDVTLRTVHNDLVNIKGEIGGLRGEMSGLRDEMGGLRGEMSELKTEMGGLKTEMGGLRGDVRDLKATVIAGFSRLPTREQHDELVGFVREANRRQDAGFSELRTDLRVLHSENQELLRAQHAEHQQLLRALVDGQRILIEENRALSARIEAIIRRQNNGGRSA